MYKRLNVPYTYPPINFLTLQDYIKSLSYVAYWPLDDGVNNPFHRVFNPATAKGRQLALTPDFATDTNWTKGAGWTIAGGTAVATSAAAGALLSPTVAILQVGRAYEITYDVVVSSGSIAVKAGSGGTGTTRSASGTYTENIVCASSAALNFNPVTTFTGTIDNVSVKELNIPASDAVPTQLLNTDVWNGLGTGAWTAGNSATLSAQTTTRHDGVSGTVLRTTRNGVTSPYAAQNVLTVGQPTRVYGWCRSDGSVAPLVRYGTTTVFTGTTSTDWQPFDVIAIPTSTDLRLGNATNTGTQYSEFDVTVVALDTGIRQGTVIVDGDQELSGVGMYTVVAAATLTKSAASPHSGSQALRVTSTGTANSGANLASALNIGKRYRLTGWYRGDGSVGIPVFRTSGLIISTGTISATWVQVDTVFTADATTLRYVNNAATATSWAEFDDVTVTEVSPLVAVPVNGAILGNVETSRLLESVSYDGVNDFSNAYSAQLNSILPTGSKTFNIFVKINLAALTDGVSHTAFRIQIDGSNNLSLLKPTINNRFTLVMITPGGTSSVNITIPTVGWHLFSIVYDSSAGSVSLYLDGVLQQAATTGMTDWVGNLTTTANVLGASTISTVFWSGFLAHAWLENVAEPAERLLEAAKLGDTF